MSGTQGFSKSEIRALPFAMTCNAQVTQQSLVLPLSACM